MKRFAALILCFLLATSLFTGCTSNTDDQPTQQPGEVQATNAPEDATPSDDAIPEGGTLTVAVSSESDSMLVTQVRSNVYNMWPIFEGLFKFDSTGTAVPYLVESYEENIENLTYTLHLHEGVLFHDGSELTAEVVKWNLENYLENGILASFLSSIESIDAVDQYTVVLHLSTWDSLLPAALARQMGYMSSKEAFDTNGEEWCAANPVGTGPFKFESWEQGVKMTYTRFDDYWQGRPNLDGIEMVVYTTDLVTQASIEAGEVDVWQVKDYNIARELEEKGFNLTISSTPGVIYNLYYECMNESDHLSNLKVRQAVTHAIDGAAISDTLLNGFGILTNQFATPGSAYYSEEISGYPYDPEKAKSLLAEAGYADGFDTTMVVWNSQAYVDAATIMKEQLAAVGINVELNLVDIAGFTVLMDGWESGLFFHPMGISNGPAPQLASMFVKGITSGAGAFSMLHPDDVDELIQKAKTSSEAESVQYFKDAAYLIFEEYCMLKSFVAIPTITVVSPDVVNCGIGVDSSFSAELWNTYIAE